MTPILQKIVSCILVVMFSSISALYASAPDESPSLYVGVIVKNYDQLLPYFLKSIENLEYNKQCIRLQFSVCSNAKGTEEALAAWVSKNRNAYQEISWTNSAPRFAGLDGITDRNRVFGELKNDYLTKCKSTESDYCLILSSDVFLLPHTIKYLMQKEAPIIAPLLRPIPEAGDPFRNFFADISESGYYKDHPDYGPIACRQKVGTFKVPCVQAAYLIQSTYVDQLSFTNHFVDWEFLAFSRSARENKIDQLICNEREFGFFLHFYKEMTAAEENSFSLKGADLEITPAVLQSIFSPYFDGDQYLKRYVDNFNFGNYAIYRVRNRDLFYLDEVNDYIKSHFLKQGLEWEDSIYQQFKEHVKPGTVALDIGGHIGTHSLHLSQLVGENGSVHVFEPQAKMFTELAINMYLNNCKNVSLHHKALGAEEKWIGMIIPKEEWMKNFPETLINEGHGTVTEAAEHVAGDKAKMIRLDDLQLNTVSFMKIDVEGYEMEVIKGGVETIKRNKPVMIVEIFQGPERIKKIKTIEDLGYVHKHLSGADYLFKPVDAASECKNL